MAPRGQVPTGKVHWMGGLQRNCQQRCCPPPSRASLGVPKLSATLEELARLAEGGGWFPWRGPCINPNTLALYVCERTQVAGRRPGGSCRWTLWASSTQKTSPSHQRTHHLQYSHPFLLLWMAGQGSGSPVKFRALWDSTGDP